MTTLSYIERCNLALNELDELIVLLATADDLVERELWMARAAAARGHISMIIRAELSAVRNDDDLKGYDC
jgi:hypothetical protein